MSKQKRNHLDTLALFATRYAIPRRTSADMAVTSALRVWWDDISPKVQKMILGEISSECRLYDNDPWLWDEFLKEKGVEDE